MFRKRVKKNFPAGTFIPTPIRVFAILHLCLAFTILLWNAGVPFMGDLYQIKSKMVLFQEVMDQKLFQTLPEKEKRDILQHYQNIQSQLKIPFQQKLTRSIEQLLFKVPPFKLAWLFFSIVISIQLLMRIEGAVQAVWLLPLLAGAYALDNRLNHSPAQLTQAELLFPSESFLVEQYVREPLSQQILEQQQQLKMGWKHYLIDQWDPQHDNSERGEFYFNLERLKRTINEKSVNKPIREPLFLLALYLFWNLSYALIAKKSLTNLENNNKLLNTK